MSDSAFTRVLRRYADQAHDNLTYRAMVPEVVLRDAAAVIDDYRHLFEPFDEAKLVDAERTAYATGVDDALAAICRVADSGGSEELTWDDAISACASAVSELP